MTVAPLRFALIGCGGMGNRHALGYAELARSRNPYVQLVAVCDEDAERASLVAGRVAAVSGRDVRVFDKLDEVLAADNVDAVDIVLPNWLHHTTAIKAIAAGKHVLVEKPLGVTASAARSVIEAAARSDRTVGVAENVRRIPGNRALRHLLASGELGRPYYMLLQKISLSDELTVAAPGAQQFSAWFNDQRRVGSLEALELGVHEADLLRYWFGDIDDVTAVTARYGDVPNGLPADMAVEDTVLANLRFKSGTTGQLALSSAGRGPDVAERRIYCSNGAVHSGAWISWDRGSVFFGDGRQTPSADYTATFLSGLSEGERERLFPPGTYDPANLEGSNRDPLRFGVAAEIVDFARAVIGGTNPEVTLEDGFLAVCLAYAILESAAARRTISVSDVASGRERAWQEPIDRELGLIE